MAALRERVIRYDVHGWARSFVARLEAVGARGGARSVLAAGARAALERVRSAPRVALLLDYDGTLVPFAPTPELAAPDPALLDLVRGSPPAHTRREWTS